LVREEHPAADQSDTGASDAGGHAVSELSLWHSLRAYPAFRTLLSGTLATNSGFWMWMLASGWLALVLTDSPFFVGLVGFAGGIPTLMFGLFVGVLIDRYSRRTVLLCAQLVVLTIAAIVAGLLILDLLSPWQLIVAAFVNGSAMSVIFPTRTAIVANLVPARSLANAVALNAAAQNSTRVVGPALAGPLIVGLGIDGTLVVCALLQVVAVVVTLRLPQHVLADGSRRTGMFRSLVEGLATVWRSEYLTGMIILAAIPTMLLMPYLNLMPVFARDVLDVGAYGLGILMAANGLGGVFGSLTVAGVRRLPETPNVLIVTAAGFALLLIVFAMTPYPLLAGALIFAAGFIAAIFLSVNNTLIQLNVDDRVRGRVMGLYVLTWGLLPVGTLPAGAVADAFGAPTAVVGMSLLAVAAILVVALRFPSVRRPSPEVQSIGVAERPSA
jgi:MFS family permease